jgi:hypothetical protein
MIQRSLTSARLPTCFIGLVGPFAWCAGYVAILIATFTALSVWAELHDREFAPRPTRSMPAVNVP